MKQPLLLIVFTVASVTTAFGQSTTPYQVDNFDFAGAVKVDLPVPVTSSRKLMRLRKQTASVDNDYSQPINLVDQLPSTNIGGALDGFTTGDANVDAFIVDSGKRN